MFYIIILMITNKRSGKGVHMDGLWIKKQLQSLALAVLAGAAISIGGILYLSVDNKIAAALLFTVGLYTICMQGLNLYTGKVGYLVNKPASYLVDLLVIWIGNLLGTGIAAFGVKATRIRHISDTAKALCQAKLDDGLLSLFLLGIFCGFLMYTAVDGYQSMHNPIILFMGVGAFILCGFEHCVADMFYFWIAGVWSVKAVLGILVISLGNSVGGVLIPLAKKIS